MSRATPTRAALGIVTTFVTACVGQLPPTTGAPAAAPATTPELKTKALQGALAEISRSNTVTRNGVYLDTLVGPTPDEYRYSWSHPRQWLEAMVATKLVDGTFGVPATRSGLRMSGYAIRGR